MMDTITNLREQQGLIPRAAQWFHSKWGVPLEAYLQSMNDALTAEGGVPAWYVVLGEREEIIAGLGVIENDFHKRKDLAPNICAVYVEEAYRGQGIARRLLDHAADELARHGLATVYLITGHTGLYERDGFTFYGMIEEDDGNMIRMYQKPTH